MRGTTRFGLLAQMAPSAASLGAAALCAAPVCAQAQSSNLPLPPYQADAAQIGASSTAVGSAPPQTLDRYGGGPAQQISPPNRYAAATPFAGRPNAKASYALAPISPSPGRYLAWSGKTQIQPAAEAQVQPQGIGGRWEAPPARPALAQAQLRVQPYPASGGRSYQPRLVAPLTQVQALPTSIYDTPRPAPAAEARAQPQAYPVPYYPGQPQVQAAPIQTAQAQTYQGGPRFYSLHRDYGIQPDAIPIPPQFFGPTADLSTPPADPVLKRVTTSSGTTHTEAVPNDDQGGQ